MPVVYLASSLALAVLELLVQIDYRKGLHGHLHYPVDFEEDLVMILDQGSLPADWRSPTHLETTQAIGDAWASSNASLLLRVPSSVVPSESNYLYNPVHPERSKLLIGDGQPFEFDRRLLHRR